MTKRYSVLRKKLTELEAELSNVVSLPPKSTPICSNPLYLEDLEQRLSFVKTLLNTEIASHPSKPGHLKHMSRRLKQLETTFHEYCWETAFSLTSSGVDHVNHYDVGDGRSTCSCTESCLNDDGDASASDGDVVDSPLPPRYKEEEEGGCVVDYKELPVVVFSSDDHEAEEIAKDKGMFDEKDDVEMKKPSCSSSEEDQRRRGSAISGVVMMCGAVATGWVLGMVSMGLVVMSSAGFLFQSGDQYGNFLTPT